MKVLRIVDKDYKCFGIFLKKFAYHYLYFKFKFKIWNCEN